VLGFEIGLGKIVMFETYDFEVCKGLPKNQAPTKFEFFYNFITSVIVETRLPCRFNSSSSLSWLKPSKFAILLKLRFR